MQRRFIVGCLVMGVLVSGPAAAGPVEEAAEAFAAGRALLARADFDGALEAFKAAARTDASNQEYGQQYAMLRQVIRMRSDCSKEQDAERWLKMSGALRTFYQDHRLYAESLPLDQERSRRDRSAESAVLLAETQIALGMHSEAVELLGALQSGEAAPRTDVLHGLALARLGRVEEAKKLAASPGKVAPDVSPRYFYDLARLQALTGDTKGAFGTLARSFEQTPPSKLDAFRTEVKKCGDLAVLASAADFAKVLATASKVKESGCSKGAGCGKCPKRGGCSKKDSKTAHKGP